MLDREAIQYFIMDEHGVIHCANIDEKNELLDTLESMGWKVGFERAEYETFMNVGTGGDILSDQIHCCKGNVWFPRPYRDFAEFVSHAFDYAGLQQFIDARGVIQCTDMEQRFDVVQELRKMGYSTRFLSEFDLDHDYPDYLLVGVSNIALKSEVTCYFDVTGRPCKMLSDFGYLPKDEPVQLSSLRDFYEMR